MLSLVSDNTKGGSSYPRQPELEAVIVKIVSKQHGVKEDPDLWLMVAAEMVAGPNPPTPSIIIGTIYQMVRNGRLVGVDFKINGCCNTFILPPETTVVMTAERSNNTVLRPVN